MPIRCYINIICIVIMLAATIAELQVHHYDVAGFTGFMVLLNSISFYLNKKYYKPLK